MESEYRRFAADRSRRHHNAILSIVIGALLALADSLVLPIIVGTAWLHSLDDSLVLTALGPAIAVAGYLVPQAMSAALVTTRTHRPSLILLGLFRIAGMALITASAFTEHWSESTRVRAFLVGLLVTSLATGAMAPPQSALITNLLASSQRKRMLAMRATVAGALGIVAGAILYRVMSKGPAYPDNFGRVFALSTLATAVVVLLVVLLKEPSGVRRRQPVRSGVSILSPLSESGFRRFLIVRLGLAFAALADPLYVVFMRDHFQLPLRYLGLYVGAIAAGVLIGKPLWSAVSRQGGSRAIVQGSVLARLAPPLIALVLPRLAESNFYGDHTEGLTWIYWISVAIFAFIGISLAGQIKGNFGYVSELTTRGNERPTLTLMNLVMAIAAFLMVAGGAVAERYDFETAFLTAAIGAFVTILLSGLLKATPARDPILISPIDLRSMATSGR